MTANLVEPSKADIDRALRVSIPGGSHARDWFLPHETERGRENVEDVVRRMLQTYRPAPILDAEVTEEMGDAVRVEPIKPTAESSAAGILRELVASHEPIVNMESIDKYHAAIDRRDSAWAAAREWKEQNG